MIFLDFLRYFLISVIGLAGGVMVSAGLFALIVKVGVVTRMAARTKTAGYCQWYEDMVSLGAAFGNAYSVFQWTLPGGYPVLLLIGLFSGVFTGCMALALAEVINAFPIFFRRLKVSQGIIFVVVAFAVGKMLGSFIQLVLYR